MENKVMYLMKIINDKIRCKIDCEMKECDLTHSQVKVLAFVCRSGGSATQKQIEQHLQVSHPTVVGLISRLEKNGFIECSFDTAHGKHKIVSLTNKAKELSEEMDRRRRKNDEALLQGLSDDEVSQLERLLSILYENAKK